jgi:hypothetical protein
MNTSQGRGQAKGWLLVQSREQQQTEGGGHGQCSSVDAAGKG